MAPQAAVKGIRAAKAWLQQNEADALLVSTRVLDTARNPAASLRSWNQLGKPLIWVLPLTATQLPEGLPATATVVAAFLHPLQLRAAIVQAIAFSEALPVATDAAADSSLDDRLQLYNDALAGMAEGVVLCTEKGNIVAANPAAEVLLNFSTAQSANPAFDEILEQARGNVAPEEQVQLFGPNGPEHFRARNLRMASRHAARWVFLQVKPLPRAHAKLGRIFIVTLQNNTAQHEGQQALERSYQLLDSVFQTATDGLLLMERGTGRCLTANPAAARLFRARRPSALLNRTPKEFVKSAVDFNGRHVPAQEMFSGLVWHGDIQYTLHDGHSFWGNISVIPVTVGGQEALQVRITDVTTTKLAELERLRLQFAINQARDALLILEDNPKGDWPVILYVNRAFSQITGFSAKEALRQPITLLNTHEEHPERSANFQKALANGDAYSFEAQMQRPDGSHYYADWYVSPVKDRDGRRVNWVAIIRDITLKKRMLDQMTRDRLERAAEVSRAMVDAQERERQRIAEELHDGLGHNLSVLKMNFSVLTERLADDANGLTQLLKSSQALLDDTTQEVRNISRDLSPTILNDFGIVVALKSLIKRITDFKVRFQHHGMEARLPETIEISVYRIVQELLNNTLKYAGATEASVQINRYEPELLEVLYEDDGTGFNLPAARRSGGLGLHNMEARARLINAEFTLDSSPGNGTMAVLTVPIGAKAGAVEVPDSLDDESPHKRIRLPDLPDPASETLNFSAPE